MNPFERYEIDPMLGPAAITERMRELTEEADETTRDELRAVWEELTMHPRRRLAIALDAFPETRAPLGGGDSGARPAYPPLDTSVSLREIAVIPRVGDVLTTGADITPTELLPAIESDPFLGAPHAAK